MALADRLIDPGDQPGDSDFEGSLRPRVLDEFIGQERVRENLGIAIDAARMRREPLDHTLLYGPPGLGKTTLAQILASEMGASIRITSGPAIERAGDLASILTSLQPGDLLFIDEIHRLNRAVEEVLYPAMEDFALDLVIGKGPAARTVRLTLPHFTLVGATTRYALLGPPLRDRFGAVYRLEFYDPAAVERILRRSASILGVELEGEGALELSRRSRGTPRVANRLLRRVRDYADVRAAGVVTREVAAEALRRLEIDEVGLDTVDHRVLVTIIEKFDGGPVGLDTIAASIAEDPDTVMDVCEPYLLQLGFIQRTPRGRVATRLAYAHLGIPMREPPPAAQPSFFDAGE